MDGWRNKIFWGDNLQVMSHLLKEFRGKIDLIYIDPPFDSKANYKSASSSKVAWRKVTKVHSKKSNTATSGTTTSTFSSFMSGSCFCVSF